MSARTIPGTEEQSGHRPPTLRDLLSRQVAGLSEAECGEVADYIEVMRSLQSEIAGLVVLRDDFALLVSPPTERAGKSHALPPAVTTDADA